MFTRILFLAVSMLGYLVGTAQFSKGDKMVGTSIGSGIYNSGNSDFTVAQIGTSQSKISNYNLNISPSIGWFLNDKTVVGGSLNINPTGNKTTYEQNGTTYQSDKSNSFNIGLGGFVRQYFKGNGKLNPFGQFGFNVGISSLNTEGFFYGGSGASAYKATYDGSSSGGFFANSSLQAGFTKMLGENAGLDFFIGYLYNYSKNTFTRNSARDNGNNGSIDETGKNETTTKFTNHGFLLGVGFQVFLKGRKK